MKIFKHLEEPFYYIQEQKTRRWYPDLQWRHETVPEPEGLLLAEGTQEEVMSKVKQQLPPDLYEALSRYYQRGRKGLVLP